MTIDSDRGDLSTQKHPSIELDLQPLTAILDNADNRLQACKTVFELGKEKIHECYQNGTSASVLIRLQTSLTDLVILKLWSEILSANEQRESSLAAVGGYGRGELHPHSDIDIAILLSKRPDKAFQENISQLITEMWDLGLEVGHSVRTVKECKSQAKEDVTVITNLMEARLLAGSVELYSKMLKTISPEKMWGPQKYFDAKMEEQAERRLKFGNDAYRLEPNLKESNGGLRDLQTIFWVSQRVYNTRQWDDLILRGLLTAAEFEILMSGMEFLWLVRYLLHRLAKRGEDRLLFDYQQEIAHEFGFTDDTNNKSIEQLMQVYFRHVTELQWINEIILQGFGGVISGVTAGTKPKAVNKRFQIRNGFLEVRHDNVFTDYPPALLEIFIVYSNEPTAEKFRANTVRLIRSSLHLIDKDFRDELTVRDMFMEIFRNPKKLTRCIRIMTRFGVLAAYLPEFSAIVGRMQYDLFHVYTVDQHTTRVIRNLRRFDLAEAEHELPHCSNVMRQITYTELLYLMGLFHDIAKGRGGDHSELGAIDALAFCHHHGLDADSSELVSWGVANHLVMSMTAQRKDISDPEVIREFAQVVGSRNKLNHLYLLTVADIRATNPELWNSFKENLLRELYESTLRFLKSGSESTEDLAEIISRKQQKTLILIGASSPDAYTELWSNLSESYFLHFQSEEIARHTTAILTRAANDDSVVLVHESPARGSTEITIYSKDHNSLFALITSTLDKLNLDIQSAAISTTLDGFALDSFYVLGDDGNPISDSSRLEQIQSRLVQAISSPDKLPKVRQTRQSRRLRHFDMSPRIEFDNDVSAGLTSVYIEATDHPGILSMIARSFMQTKTSVHTAKIATFGERIEDVFYVTDARGEQLTSKGGQQELVRVLLKNLPQYGDKDSVIDQYNANQGDNGKTRLSRGDKNRL